MNWFLGRGVGRTGSLAGCRKNWFLGRGVGRTGSLAGV